jgi:hypothetical protein
MVGNLDNSALQALLASLQTPQQPGVAAPQTYPGVPPAASAPQAAQIDMNALLGNLRSAAAAGQPAAYGAAPAPVYGPAVPAGTGGYGGVVDPAQQVQSIMEQLKRAAH